jgi:hypothetical protein
VDSSPRLSLAKASTSLVQVEQYRVISPLGDDTAGVPLGRQGIVDEIAATCLFLVSEDAGLIADRRFTSMAVHTITDLRS